MRSVGQFAGSSAPHCDGATCFSSLAGRPPASDWLLLKEPRDKVLLGREGTSGGTVGGGGLQCEKGRVVSPGAPVMSSVLPPTAETVRSRKQIQCCPTFSSPLPRSLAVRMERKQEGAISKVTVWCDQRTPHPRPRPHPHQTKQG